MSRVEFEECNCLCHKQGMEFSVMHFMPCCVECEYCGKNIILSSYKEHVMKCKEKLEKEEK